MCNELRTLLRTPQTPPFWTNSKVDMARFVYPHNLVARRSAFATLPNAWNEGELKGEVGSGSLKCQNRKNNEKKAKVNLILSHGNHTFLISDLQIQPQAFRHTHCISRKKNVFFNVKKGPIQGSICFKLVLELLVLLTLSKMALRLFKTILKWLFRVRKNM